MNLRFYETFAMVFPLAPGSLQAHQNAITTLTYCTKQLRKYSSKSKVYSQCNFSAGCTTVILDECHNTKMQFDDLMSFGYLAVFLKMDQKTSFFSLIFVIS